jgi:hypothetical protein
MIETDFEQIFEKHEQPKPLPKVLPHTFMCDEILKALIKKAGTDIGVEATAEVIRRSVSEGLKKALEYKKRR